MEIIPAILESDWKNVEGKIKQVEGLTDWIQLDVSDGLFTDNKTWSNPHDLFGVRLNLNQEVHLMINNPWESAEAWLASPAKRIVVQVEALASPESVKFAEIVFTAKKYGKEVVWGFKIETDWEPYKELVRDPHARVLFLAVEPGRQGQEFNPAVLEKIKSLQAAHPRVKIAVDGGINLENIKLVKESGAASAVVGSYIFNSSDPKTALNRLVEKVI
ncbi:MAG: hypothetical protein HYT38_02060 [Candidatus Sungbacteria bacterium]|uniref:Ribulose-phosphate 3-epimerase n=1 Tax=Candidatus Sungiibacteriota bacterium TaxID=2750080 RepID=A0A931YDK1_9BACT|nr:hypothetical protein [Candidatus Sungbacteria bacterium]MBI2465980.1 hypothetical protein [Candidatus Sungbacteria bacterium]